MIARRRRGQAIVVGGGVAGCSLTLELARAGFEVTLLESHGPGGAGASSLPAALLNPYRGRSARPGPLDIAGLAAVRQLTDELHGAGLEPGVHWTGVLRVADNERQARSWRRTGHLRELPTVPAGYRAPHGSFLVEGGGWLRPDLFLAALTGLAVRHGANIHGTTPVEHVERRGGTWHASSGGREWGAGLVFLCTGAAPVPGVAVPALERVAGEIIVLRCAIPLPYPVAGPVYLAPLGGGLVTVGGNHRSAAEPDPEAPRLLRASAARIVPALAEARTERVWSGVRARTPDQVPIARRLDEGLYFMGGFGGRGFLTATLLARRLVATLPP